MRALVLASEQATSRSMETRLCAEGYAVDAVSTLPGAQMARSDIDYDCMVLDREAAGGDALDWVAELRSKGDTVFAVLLGDDNSSKERLRAFKAGADDYMAKPIEVEELALRLRRAVARVPAVPPEIPPVQEIGSLAISRALRQVRVSGKVVVLSATQFRLVEYLLSHRSRLVTSDELRRNCWDENLPSTSDPLPPQMSRVRKAFARVMEVRSPKFGLYWAWIPGVDPADALEPSGEADGGVTGSADGPGKFSGSGG